MRLPVPGSSENMEQDLSSAGGGGNDNKEEGIWGGTSPPSPGGSDEAGLTCLLSLVLFLPSIGL